MDLNKLSDIDLSLYAQGRLREMSDVSLRYLAGHKFGAGETFVANVEREATSSYRGLSGEDSEEDQQAESERNMMSENNTAAMVGGVVTGTLLDFVTLPVGFLKLLKVGGAVATGALQGAVAGGFGGLVQPTYTEFGDSKTMQVGAGVVGGAAIGGLLGRLFGGKTNKAASKAEQDAVRSVDEAGNVVDAQGNIMSKAGVNRDEVGNVLDEAGSVVTKASEAPPIKAPDNVQWNPTTKAVEVFEDVIPPSPSLPRQLAGAKPKFNKYETVFDNDLDKAFYIIGNPASKSQQHAAYFDWAQKVTGLDERSLKVVARTARDKLSKRLGSSTAEGNKLKAEATDISKGFLEKATQAQRISKPFKSVTPVYKDSFDADDVATLGKLGIEPMTLKDMRYGFRDVITKKPIRNQEFLERTQALGWEFDKAAFNAKVAASKGEKVADKVPEDIGIPKQYGSAGAAGTRIERMYGPDLNPSAAQMSPDELLTRLLSTGDDPRIVFPKEIRPLTSGNRINEARRGATMLNRIIKEHGNMVEFMLKRKGLAMNMTQDEVAGFKWFYADAMKKRDDVLEKVTELAGRGESFDSAAGAKYAEDLMYYTGIDLFYKNDGAKISRAFAARKAISSAIKQNRALKGIFPETSC